QPHTRGHSHPLVGESKQQQAIRYAHSFLSLPVFAEAGLRKACKTTKPGFRRACCCFVEPKIQNSNSFLEDLRKINQLKDSPCQNDLDVKKVNQPKPKSSKMSRI